MPNVRSTTGQFAEGAPKRGFTLTELMVTVTIIGVLAAFTVPSYHRAVTQSAVDIAGANLRAIWAAQRLYYLENQTFTSDLQQLQKLGILDGVLLTGDIAEAEPGKHWESFYWYSITVGPDAGTLPFTTFTAKANTSTYTEYTSTLTIDQDGLMSGSVKANGSTAETKPVDLW